MMKNYYWIALVIVIALSAGSYVLKKATSKENTQHITAEQGSIVNIHNEIKEEDSKLWFMPDGFTVGTKPNDIKETYFEVNWQF